MDPCKRPQGTTSDRTRWRKAQSIIVSALQVSFRYDQIIATKSMACPRAWDLDNNILISTIWEPVWNCISLQNYRCLEWFVREKRKWVVISIHEKFHSYSDLGFASTLCWLTPTFDHCQITLLSIYGGMKWTLDFQDGRSDTISRYMTDICHPPPDLLMTNKTYDQPL